MRMKTLTVVFLTTFTMTVANPVHSFGETKIVQTIPTLNQEFKLNRFDYTIPCKTNSVMKLGINNNASNSISFLGDKIKGTRNFSRKISPGEGLKIFISGKTYRIRCIPDDFPNILITGTQPFSANSIAISPTIFSQATPLTKSNRYVAVLDKWGTPIFWHQNEGTSPILFDVLFDKYLAWTDSKGSNFPYNLSGSFVLTDFDLKPILTLSNVDQHEILPTSRNTIYLIRYIPRDCVAGIGQECDDLTKFGGTSRATILDNVIEEYDLNGKLLWSWSTKNNIDIAETPSKYYGPSKPGSDTYYDYFHINSIDEDRTHIYISARNTDAIYAIRKSTGRINWKIGGTKVAVSLETPSGFNLSAQHDLRSLPNGDFTVFDNRTGLGEAVRGIKFRIENSEVKILQIISDNRFKGAMCCGSFRELGNGRYLANWGNNSVIAELNSSSRISTTLTFLNGISSYRAVPKNLSWKTLEALKNAMDQ
jgi:hypothetical protein